MKKRLCCILMLIVLILNSSLMLIISEAVEEIQNAKEEKAEALAEIKLTKYENFDTTGENVEGGSKGVLAQFNLKTGIRYKETEEYKPLQKTVTSINLPWIGEYKPSRVEVIIKSTQATNGGKNAKYEYNESTGILVITAENEEYSEKVEEARDEYEIICIYKSECYDIENEKELKVSVNIDEYINDEAKTKINKRLEETYTVNENVGNSISVEHKTEDIYDGYIKANKLKEENQYETTYKETMELMISNKEIAKKYEIQEKTEGVEYKETVIEKNKVLEFIGEKGQIEILDSEGNVVKVINKDTEADENGKIRITYENPKDNIDIKISNAKKEGIIEIENTKTIKPTTQIEENKIKIQDTVRGINTIKKEETNQETEEVKEIEEDTVKYDYQTESETEIKEAKSKIDTKINTEIFVNNTKNEVVITTTLITNSAECSLYKNPAIEIEMPEEVEKVEIETPEIMYDNQIFEVEAAKVMSNINGNQVINVQLKGSQEAYLNSELVEGINIRIPVAVTLKKNINDKVAKIITTVSNEMVEQKEVKETEITLLNKVINVATEIYGPKEENTSTTEIKDGVVYEKDGIKAEIIEEVGNSEVANGGIVYEQQIIKYNLKVINTNKVPKKVTLNVDIPDEMKLVELTIPSYKYNEEKEIYEYGGSYSYIEKEDKQAKIEFEVAAEETETEFIELGVNDLPDDAQEKESNISNILTIDGKEVEKFDIKNIVKKAQVEVSMECHIGNDRKDWAYLISVTNVLGKEINNVKLTFETSSIFEIETVRKLKNQTEFDKADELEHNGGNIWTYTIEQLEAEQTIYYYITGEVGEVDETQGNEYEITAVATVYGENIATYSSNKTRMLGYVESVDLQMTADKEKLKKDDVITYKVVIENTGKTWGNLGKFTNIKVEDVIPRELQPIDVTYNKFTIQAEEKPELPSLIYRYTEEKNVVKDLSNLFIADGYDEDDMPNIDFELSIPEGKTITMIIRAKAKMLLKDTEIMNTVKVTGPNIKTKTADVKTKILKYDSTEDTDPDKVNVKGVSLNMTSTTLKIKEQKQLVATIEPKNATNKEVQWISENPQIVKVDENGVITGVSQGTTTVIVATKENGLTAKCIVTVKDEENEDPNSVKVEGVKIDPTSMILKIKEEKQITAEVVPENATNKKIQWVSEDTTVASVDENGKVTGVSQGTTKIKAVSEDGGKEATCEVTVKNETISKITISGTAWIDENEDGKKESTEQKYSDLKVMLYDYNKNEFVKENGNIKEVTTNEQGEYKFENLEQGKYIVVFLYDTDLYSLTEYQKKDVIESKNSDAITKTVGIDGKTITAGLTDILNANADISNIDIGLVKNKKFDLEMKKYISKVTVQTKDNKVKTYEFDDKQFGKVEINSKKIDGALVVIEYKMVITNKGELAGKVVSIEDQIPEGLSFKSELNNAWYEKNGKVYTNNLSGQTIEVGESKEVKLILTKEVNSSNVGTITNTSTILTSSNEKAREDENRENDTSKAELIIGISTGLVKWLGITIATIVGLIVIALGIKFGKKYLKNMVFILVFAICLVGNMHSVFGLGIKGVNTDWPTCGEDAIGDDGNAYKCTNHGLYFCNNVYHPASGGATGKTESYNSGWLKTEAGANAKLNLSGSGGSAKFTKYDNDYNLVGPFRFDSDNSSASATITYSYKDKYGNESSGGAETTGFSWNSDFYIKVPRNVVQVLSVNVDAVYKVEKYEYKIVTYNVTYNYACSATPGCRSWKGQKKGWQGCNHNGIQSMGRTGTEEAAPEYRSGTLTASASISGQWTSYGDLTIYKKDTDSGAVQQNAKFKVLRENNYSQAMVIYQNEEWVNEITITSGIELSVDPNAISRYEVSAKINGISGYTVSFTGDNNSATTIVTSNTGIIAIKNLLYGKYSFVEITNLNYGYTKNETLIQDGFAPSANTDVAINNAKQVGNLNITKVDLDNQGIKLRNTEFVLSSSSGYLIIKGDGDNVQKDGSGWIKRATGSVTIPNSTNINTNPTIKYTSNINEATVFITDDNGKFSINNLLRSTNGSSAISYTLTEIVNKNYGYTKMVTEKNITMSRLENKNVTIKNDKQVGDIKIKKSDDRVESKVLSNVEFVLRSSENSSKFIKIKGTGGSVTQDGAGWVARAVGTVRVNDDSNANPMIKYVDSMSDATVFVTDANGEINIQNLLNNRNGSVPITYQLQEIKNPNYGYLAYSPSEKIAMNYGVTFQGDNVNTAGWVSPRKNTTVTKVRNHQYYICIDGNVWEEIANNKSNTSNNLYDNGTDALVEGLKVYLYKSGRLINTTTTNEDGWYGFGTRKNSQTYVNADYLTEENGNLYIDDLEKYYIEFEYDGLKFTSISAIIDYKNENYERTSKIAETPSGREDRKDRTSVNADFSEITNGTSRNNRKEVYKLEYDYNTDTHMSTYIDHWGYEYNSDKTKLKITPNKDYEIIASTQTSGLNLKTAWEARFKGVGAEVVKNVNLGIVRREQADLAVSSDIDSTNIKVGNYENTYTYRKREEYQNQNENDPKYDGAEDGFGVDVKFGNGQGSYTSRNLNMYTRRVYESDLTYYYQSNNDDLMQVYVTYKIRVKNQSATIKAKINELVNYYDTRYEIVDSWYINGQETKQVGKEAWTSTSKYGESYKDDNGYAAVYTQTISEIQIEAGKYVDVYIKFRLKPEAVKALLQNQTTLNNVTEITSFSMVTGNNVPYAAIDKDSNPGSVKEIKLKDNNKTTSERKDKPVYTIEQKVLDMTYYEDDTDYAPSFIIGIEEEEPTRGLSGTVFEDENSKFNDNETHMGEERLGDGILTTDGSTGRREDNHRIKGATVELLDTNLKPITLYKLSVNSSGELKVKTEEARTTTNEKGEYELLGVIPGQYLIRYTYNQTCYITDKDGNNIGGPINVRDYKSTIITSDIIKQALSMGTSSERKGNLNWILTYDKIPQNGNYTTDEASKSKDLTGLIRYSDAVDDINKRNELDDVYYETYGQNITMTADTAYFDVGVEYSKVDGDANKVSYTDYKDEYKLDNDKIVVLDDTGRLKIVETYYAVNPYQDFGIIERARQDYELNKRITNLKLVLANGQILLQGNPYREFPEISNNLKEDWNNIETSAANALPYTRAVPGQVNVEIDNELIQGAEVNIEYTITIKNESELDYKYTVNPNYYYYGDSTGIDKLGTAIRKVVDYMDESIVYDTEKNEKLEWKKTTAEDLKAWEDEDSYDKKRLISDEVYEGIKTGYSIAVTEYFYEHAIEIGKVGTIKIYGNKLLSTEENGVRVGNHAEILETEGIRSLWGSTPGNYNPSNNGGSPHELDDDKSVLIITPPTGIKNNVVLIVTAVTIVLVCFAGGVYLIKKKIL